MCVQYEENVNSCILVTVQVRDLWLSFKVKHGPVAFILKLMTSRQQGIRNP